MNDFQSQKGLIRDYYNELDSSDVTAIPTVLKKYTSSDYLWRGMHPFYEQQGPVAVADVFWRPLRESFTNIQRRPDIFMAGANDCDKGNTQWVCCMGHLMGLFDVDWLGIPATGKMTFLRFAEFNRVIDGKITETAMFCDIIGVMQQAGIQALPAQTGAAGVTPGPQTHDGLMYDVQNPVEGVKTLELVNRMTTDLTTSDMGSSQDELARTWHSNMIWWGPAGIGATYTLERYDQQHQRPFNEGLSDIVFNGHVSRIAEGNYAGWFGWANLSMTASGGFLGLPGSKAPTEMRVVDIYRRDGDLLAENWIFIDLLHYLSLQGLDVLSRLRAMQTHQ